MALTMQLFFLLLLPAALLLPPAARAGEIIGGREAQPHSRPYMALVNIEGGGGRRSRCGGFLIREDVVVTAAHCNCYWCHISVLLGAHNLAVGERGRQEIRVRRRVPHPDYNKKRFENDIMLLQLERKAQLNRWVSPVRLPWAHQPVPPGTMCSVAGWGQTSPHSQRLSDRLQEVDVMVMPPATCKYHHYNYDPSTMLCAGDPRKGRSAFKGDSGGPLVCRGTAQGIVSYGSIDGTPPAVYTRVSTFIPWIEKMMKKLQP